MSTSLPLFSWQSLRNDWQHLALSYAVRALSKPEARVSVWRMSPGCRAEFGIWRDDKSSGIVQC